MKLRTKVLLISSSLIWAVIVASVVVSKLPKTQTAPVVPVAVETNPDLNELAELINKDRAAVGLAPLTRDSDLDASATDKCNDMVTNNYWGHRNYDGTRGYEYIKRYKSSSFISENLAYGSDTSSKVNNGWLASPAHKAAILNQRYTSVGYATCSVPFYKNMVVQHFSN